MAVGWAGDNAVNEQIEDSINDEIYRARKNVPSGESLEYCEECGKKIAKSNDTCTNCGYKFERDGKFCPKCGKKRE